MGNSTPDGDAVTSSDVSKLAEMISDIRVAMLVTFPGDSPAHARPMYTQSVDPKNFDGTLWFMTGAGSGKVDEIKEDSHVLITYSAPDKNRYVVVNGSARVERNPAKAKELWNVHAKGWFPGGPDDPNLRLLRIRIESAEYWDGPSNTSYMLSLLKAVVTGTRVDTESDHGKIEA